jgi:PAS domain S-box-containing protein
VEEALARANERLNLAIDSGSVGGWDFDLKTDKNVWFGKAHAQLGMTPEETLGSRQEFWDHVHEDDREHLRHAFRVAKDKHEEFAEDFRVVWRDGTTHWLRSRGRYHYGANGQPERMLGISLDITERKMAEDKLREYERAVEGSGEMITVLDREYRYLIANNQFLKIRKMTREQVVGHYAHEVLNKGFFESVVKPRLDECFQAKVVRCETKYAYPEIGERDLFISYFPIEGANGIDRVACILHDITDRKRAEEALLEMNRTLAAQGSLLRSREELLRVFVKNVPAAVAMLDRDMRYLQVSDRWCSDYLPGRAQILGRSHYEIFPDMPERWKEVHRRALQGETLRAEEDRWDGQDGPHWARWEVRPWKTAEGAVGGILILAEDITRRKQMEEALSDLSRKLIESQEQERARIGRELHDDINQRLAMLSIELERLQNDPSELQNRVQELRKQMNEISTDVQALSHDLHSSKLEYLGVAAGMKSWCKEFSERQKLEIDFRSEVPSALPFEVGLSLFRVLQEALNNVTKHSAVRRVEVQLREDSGEIHLVISDMGRGFDIESALQGKGLGLTSMRERVRLLNGTIAIESKPNGGTTIRVRVPLGSGKLSKRAVG